MEIVGLSWMIRTKKKKKPLSFLSSDKGSEEEKIDLKILKQDESNKYQ